MVPIGPWVSPKHLKTSLIVTGAIINKVKLNRTEFKRQQFLSSNSRVTQPLLVLGALFRQAGWNILSKRRVRTSLRRKSLDWRLRRRVTSAALYGTTKRNKTGQKKKRDIVLFSCPSGKTGTNQTNRRTKENGVGLISEGQREEKVLKEKKKKRFRWGESSNRNRMRALLRAVVSPSFVGRRPSLLKAVFFSAARR